MEEVELEDLWRDH